MDKNLIQQFKKILQSEKRKIEEDLKRFAQKGEIEGDWETKFPHYDGTSGNDSLERMADELEEYENLRALEHRLEIRLGNINLALEKIKKGTYGICERCGKEIEIERLKNFPEAKLCKNCLRREK